MPAKRSVATAATRLPPVPAKLRASAKRPAARALPPRLEDLPNVGRAVAADFRRLGIGTPDEIRGRDPYMLYHDLCRATRARVDPCMLDTFIAVVRYVDGGPAKPWWHYTAERKRVLPGALPAARHAPDTPPATPHRT